MADNWDWFFHLLWLCVEGSWLFEAALPRHAIYGLGFSADIIGGECCGASDVKDTSASTELLIPSLNCRFGKQSIWVLTYFLYLSQSVLLEVRKCVRSVYYGWSQSWTKMGEWSDERSVKCSPWTWNLSTVLVTAKSTKTCFLWGTVVQYVDLPGELRSSLFLSASEVQLSSFGVSESKSQMDVFCIVVTSR